VLALQNVSRHFNDKVAVEEVSITLTSGSVTGLLGANGAGKSTLLKLIAGQLPAAAGSIRLDDCQIKPTRAGVRKQIHLIDTPRPSDAPCATPIFEMIRDYGITRDTLPSCWTSHSLADSMPMVCKFFSRRSVNMLPQAGSFFSVPNGPLRLIRWLIAW